MSTSRGSRGEDVAPDENAEQDADTRARINAELDARTAARRGLTATIGPNVKTYQGRELRATGAVTAGGVPVYEFAVALPSLVPPDAVPVGGNEPDSREWTAVLCLEGIPTSDGRMLGIDAVGWRELPLTLMAMLTSDHGGAGGAIAIIAGRIDAIDKVPTATAISAGLLEDREEGYPADAVAVVGRGVFDNSWDGDEVMRLVGDRTLRGISIDLAPERVEVVELPMAEGDENNLMGAYLEIVTQGEIMGATVVPFAAFAEAVIHVDTVGEEAGASEEPEPVIAAMRAKRTLRVSVNAAIVAAGARAYKAVDYSDSSMIACSPTSEQCMALALPGGQPAGDMHVTLAYLHDPDAVDFDALHKVVAGVAAAHAPIEGQVGGAGYFAPAVQSGDASAERAKSADGVTAALTPEEISTLIETNRAELLAAGETIDGDVWIPSDAYLAAWAAKPPAVADAETPATSESAPADGTAPGDDAAEPGPLHPHVALVDAPGLSKMRASLCAALDEAGIPFAQNHDFTPHITLGYEAAAGVPAAHLAGSPVSFGHLTVHQGATRTDHPMTPGDDAEAVTASAAGLAPETPPSDWFENPELDGPTGITITDEGRIYGHLATWGTCHIGRMDECVQPPESLTDYALFHLGHVLSSEGDLIPVGTLTMDTGHADLHLNSTAATMHYDHTGTQVADVRVGDDEHGIWFAGAIRPELDSRAIRKLRASRISGDWRPHDGTREMVAALVVNVGGFPVVRPRTAVAASGQLLGLVAAGIDLVAAPADERSLRTRVLALAERARPGSLDERRAALAARARA
jgi:2'-5' RNA ligase